MSIIKLNRIFLPIDVVSNVVEIEKYKELWKENGKNLPSSLLARLKNVGAFESIGSSNRIEGNTLSDADVEKVLQGLSTKSFSSRDEKEVKGYSEALNTIYDSYKAIALTENYIKQFHLIKKFRAQTPSSKC